MMEGDKKRPSAESLVIGVVALVLLLMAVAWPFMALWNSNVPLLFDGVHELTYGQSFAFLLLLYIAGRIMRFGSEQR